MKVVILSSLLVCVLARAQTDQTAAVKRSKALHDECIPHFQITKASLEEALAVIRNGWERKHPDEPFPVGFTDFTLSKDAAEREEPLITLDLKKVPYIVALRAVATLSFRHLAEKSGLVQLEQVTGIIEDWSTETYHVTPAVLAGLGLRSESSPEQIQKAFARFGIQFEGGMMAALADAGKLLCVRNLPKQQQQIAGILILLKNGFEIRKSPAKTDAPASNTKGPQPQR